MPVNTLLAYCNGHICNDASGTYIFARSHLLECRFVNKRHAIACACLFTCLTRARCAIHHMPKIYNLSLLVFLSDFLLFQNWSSYFFSFIICGKSCSCRSLCFFFSFDCSFACCTTKNYFLILPQKLKSS